MRARLNFRKWATGFGAIGGAMFFYPNDNNDNQLPRKHNSWMSLSAPWVKWDPNWDRLYSLSSLSLLFIRNYY